MLPCADKNGSTAKVMQPEFRDTYQVLKKDILYAQPLMGEQCTGSKQTNLQVGRVAIFQFGT